MLDLERQLHEAAVRLEPVGAQREEIAALKQELHEKQQDTFNLRNKLQELNFNR